MTDYEYMKQLMAEASVRRDELMKSAWEKEKARIQSVLNAEPLPDTVAEFTMLLLEVEFKIGYSEGIKNAGLQLGEALGLDKLEEILKSPPINSSLN